jgi:hypothetical protein
MPSSTGRWVGVLLQDVTSDLDEAAQVCRRESHAVARASSCLMHCKTYGMNTGPIGCIIRMPQRRHAKAAVSPPGEWGCGDDVRCIYRLL